MKSHLKWSDIETAVYEYVKAKGIKLSLEEFRKPKRGAGGRTYIGPKWYTLNSFTLGKRAPAWFRVGDAGDYDDSLWRGVNAWVAFCSMVRAGQDKDLTCEQFCNEWMGA